jgi:putative transcriptional regulator
MNARNLEGKALVASPYLTETNFMRSVVFIVNHDEEGAFGLVLNRPTDLTVGQLLREALEVESDVADPIFCGGPVSGPVVALHNCGGVGATPCAPGIWFSEDQEELIAICQQAGCRYRFFDGYSGWAPQQLESELQHGGWLVWELEAGEVFSPAEDIWERAVKEIGRDILAGGIDPARIPNDPSAN